MELTSLVIALLSLVFSIFTYIVTLIYEKRKVTIEAINLLQNEVLDKFVSVNSDNAKLIIENLDNAQCKEAYNDYRALIARLEHFAIGVYEHIYDFHIVNILLGSHFIYLYKKIIPIIDEANKHEKSIQHFIHFVKLVEKLDSKQKILNKGRI